MTDKKQKQKQNKKRSRLRSSFYFHDTTEIKGFAPLVTGAGLAPELGHPVQDRVSRDCSNRFVQSLSCPRYCCCVTMQTSRPALYQPHQAFSFARIHRCTSQNVRFGGYFI